MLFQGRSVHIFLSTCIVGEPTLPLKHGEELGLGLVVSILMIPGLEESQQNSRTQLWSFIFLVAIITRGRISNRRVD